MTHIGQEPVSMYHYITEEKAVLLEILAHRVEIAESFVTRWAPGTFHQIILSGSGTSFHAALAIKPFLEKSLNVSVRVEYPIPFRDLGYIFDPRHTIFIGISQTGQSRSTIEALKKAKALGAFTAAISGDVKSALSQNADLQIPMGCGAELCPAKTKGYMASIAVLTVLGLEVAKARQTITGEQYLDYVERIGRTANNLDAIISAATKWVDSIKVELAGSKRLLLLGYGNNYANVLEGALKMLETMRFGVCGYEFEEFCHGIYNSIDRDAYLIYLASEGGDKERLARLKTILSESSEHQFIVTKGIDGYQPTERDCIAPFIDDPDFSIFEYIIPIQIIAALVPQELGIDPLRPSDPKFHSKIGSKLP